MRTKRRSTDSLLGHIWGLFILLNVCVYILHGLIFR